MMTPEELNDIVLKVNGITEDRDKLNKYVKDLCIKSYVPHPFNWNTYIKSVDTPGVGYLQDYILKSSLSSALAKKQFPQELISIMAAMKFSREGYGKDKISFNIPNGDQNYYQINEYMGAAFQFEDYILYGLYHSKVKCTLNELYKTISYPVWERKWY